MAHILGHDRSQRLLLPEAVDDYVGPDHPVRFVEAFVDGLDLEAAGFARVEPKVTGRPGYAPADLLKLYIYGYLNRVRSSRRLEAEAEVEEPPIDLAELPGEVGVAQEALQRADPRRLGVFLNGHVLAVEGCDSR